MNDVQEANFVACEMLPDGHYHGRLSVGVAQHLARRLPSIVLPPYLTINVHVEQQAETSLALIQFIQALSKKPRLQELRWKSPLSWTSLTTLVDSFAPSQLAVLSVNIKDPMDNCAREQVVQVASRLARIATRQLDLVFGQEWQLSSSASASLEAWLQGLQTSNAQSSTLSFSSMVTPTRVSLTIPFYTESTWSKQAKLIQAHPGVINNLTVQGGNWGPRAWTGLISCLQTPGLHTLTLSRVNLADQRVPTRSIQDLHQVLSTTLLQELRFVDLTGSTSGDSLVLIRTVLASMACRDNDNEEIDYHAAPGMAQPSSFSSCAIKSLTLKTRLSGGFGDEYALSMHAILAEYLPKMPHLRTLNCRWHPSTSVLLYKALQYNTSLLWADSGKAVRRMLEPVLQRNHLLRETQDFCQVARPMDQVLDFGKRHSLWQTEDDKKNLSQISLSAIFWLVRACLPPNVGTFTLESVAESTFTERYLDVETMDRERSLEVILGDTPMID